MIRIHPLQSVQWGRHENCGGIAAGKGKALSFMGSMLRKGSCKSTRREGGTPGQREEPLEQPAPGEAGIIDTRILQLFERNFSFHRFIGIRERFTAMLLHTLSDAG
jgi:hypothetical protein